MEEKSLWQERRALLTNISGKWHNTETNQTMVFSPCETSADEAKLIITENGKDAVTTVYSISTFLPENFEAVFYIDLGTNWDDKHWYKVKEITPTNMRLIEISKSVGRNEMGNELYYTKK